MTSQAYSGEQRSGETAAELQPTPAEPPVNTGSSGRICPNSPTNHPAPAPSRSGANGGDGTGNTGSGGIENGPDEKPQPDHSPAAVETCFYCGRRLTGDFERDHFPVPVRFGGKDTVPSCLQCHDAKDRKRLHGWTIEGAAKAVEAITTLPAGPARLFMAKMLVWALDLAHENTDLRRQLREARGEREPKAALPAEALEHDASAVHAGGTR